jgi:hypothetical protein
MPATRPDEISDCVSLSDKLTALDRGLVPEEGAVDPFLAAGVDELPPHEACVGMFGSKDDLFAWTSEAIAHTSVPVLEAGVVAFVECEAVRIAIFRQPPIRSHLEQSF